MHMLQRAAYTLVIGQRFRYFDVKIYCIACVWIQWCWYFEKNTKYICLSSMVGALAGSLLLPCLPVSIGWALSYIIQYNFLTLLIISMYIFIASCFIAHVPCHITFISLCFFTQIINHMAVCLCWLPGTWAKSYTPGHRMMTKVFQSMTKMCL